MMPRALLCGLLLTGLTSAQQVTIDFDHVSAPGPFHFITPGLNNGPLLEYPEVTLDGGVILSDSLFGNSATSDPNIYATCDTCTLGDGSGLPGFISGSFTFEVDAIDLDVVNGSTASAGSFTLTAFDSGGAEVASDTVVAAPMGSAGFVQHLAVSGPGVRSFTVTAVLPGGYSFAIDTLVFHEVEGSWIGLGQGLAGTHGVPSLTGLGSLQGGDTVMLSMVGALENAPTTLVVGLAELAAPFKGGVLVPRPDILIPGLLTGPTGRLQLSAPWPTGLPPGVSVWFQHWIVDAGGPAGFSASDALQAVTP
jgi:hypothetical protein